MRISVLLLASLSFAAAAHAEVKTVTVEAEVAADGDASSVEANLKRAARRNAVEQGAGVLVSSNTVIRDYAAVSDEIVTSAKGILSDEQWGPITAGATAGTKKIKLTAKVSPDAIDHAVCDVIKANHDPSVALVFVEKIGDENKWTTERGLVEAMFQAAFHEACFTMKEPGIKVTEVSANGDLPQDEIEKIVKNTQAQYVVLGSGKIIKGQATIFNGTAMNGYSLSASLRLINTSTNEIEATGSGSAQVMGVSPENALKATDKTHDVVKTVMDQLMKKIAERWSSDQINASRVSVTLKNADVTAASSFHALVSKLAPSSKVEERDVKNGAAAFDVEIDGGAEALSKLVNQKKLGKLTIRVTERSRGKIVAELSDKS